MKQISMNFIEIKSNDFFTICTSIRKKSVYAEISHNNGNIRFIPVEINDDNLDNIFDMREIITLNEKLPQVELIYLFMANNILHIKCNIVTLGIITLIVKSIKIKDDPNPKLIE